MNPPELLVRTPLIIYLDKDFFKPTLYKVRGPGHLCILSMYNSIDHEHLTVDHTT